MSDNDLTEDKLDTETHAAEQLLPGSTATLKVPPAAPFVIGVIMFAASFWAGGRIADGEVALLKLDDRTAQGHLVKAKVMVPPGAVLTPEALEEVRVFANRIEPYCVNSIAATQGKKTKYGLSVGEIVTVKDLE